MGRKKKVQRLRGEAWKPRIRERPDRNVWVVDCGYAFGKDKRLKRTFASLEEAEAWAATKKTEYDAQLLQRKEDDKNGAIFRMSSLTDTQRRDIRIAMTKMDNDTVRIVRAVDFYLKHNTRAATSRLLCRVYHEYLRAKKRAGRRPGTVKDAHVKLRPFVKAYRKAAIHEVTTNDVERWLASRKFTAATYNAYRAAIVALFNYAVKREYLERNPATRIDEIATDQGMPEIHTVDEVRRILHAARDFIPLRVDNEGKAVPETNTVMIHEARSRIVPYLAIGYFAGLRPENELTNLDWKDIDFEAQTIRVDPATAKKRRQRYVDMTDNLVAWLTPYVQRTGKIGFSRRYFRRIRTKAKVKWAKDIMRHCFGSYLVAHNQDPRKTADQMGHTRTSELFDSYRNLVKKSAAAEYWAIVPEPKGNVIKVPIAKAG